MFILPDDETTSGLLAIWIPSATLVVLAVALTTAVAIFYFRRIRPRMMRRQMQLNGTPHPENMLAQDPLLVDPVTLASPFSYRQAIDDGNVYYVSRGYKTLGMV